MSLNESGKAYPTTYKGIPVTPAFRIRTKETVWKVDGVAFPTRQAACWHIDEHEAQLQHLVIPSHVVSDS